jgi:hypothetical protein
MSSAPGLCPDSTAKSAYRWPRSVAGNPQPSLHPSRQRRPFACVDACGVPAGQGPGANGATRFASISSAKSIASLASAKNAPAPALYSPVSESTNHSRARLRHSSASPMSSPAVWSSCGPQIKQSILPNGKSNKRIVGQFSGRQSQRSLEFIPIRSLAARDPDAPGNYAMHSRFPSPDHGCPASTAESDL